MMGQKEVRDLLKKKDTWMSVQDIADILQQGKGSINSNLKRLEKQGDVVRYERNPFFGGNLWKINPVGDWHEKRI